MFSTLARGYGALQASTQPQSATSTIDRLCDRLLSGDERDDRKAALLGLKGLSRDWKAVRLLSFLSLQGSRASGRRDSDTTTRWGGHGRRRPRGSLGQQRSSAAACSHSH